MTNGVISLNAFKRVCCLHSDRIFLGVVAFDFMWYSVHDSVSCFKSWNAFPLVYPVASVVRRSITSSPVQRIPYHAYNFHESQNAIELKVHFCRILIAAMFSICMCVTELAGDSF